MRKINSATPARPLSLALLAVSVTALPVTALLVTALLVTAPLHAASQSRLQCFNPRQVVDFERLSTTRMLVRTQRSAFELKLSGGCFDPTERPIIRFQSAGPGEQICGALGDYVLFSDTDRCRILELTAITRAAYDTLQHPDH